MPGHDEVEEPGQAPGVWEPPPKEECQEPQTYPTALGEPGDILRVRMVYDLRDNLVDFALIFMTGAPGALSDVAHADIRHTGLHVHWFYRDGTELRRQEISPVTTLPEVQAAYNEAFDRVTRNWEEYKRRWRRG
jgi:hypothetical protein